MKKSIFITCTSLLVTLPFSAQTLIAHPQNGSGEGGELLLMGSNSNYNPWYIDNYQGYLRFFNGSGEFFKMTPLGEVIIPSSKVGIGTASPNTTLTIQGPSSTEYEGSDNSHGGTYHLELIGTSADKALLKGPTITFRSPANTGGTNTWAMARLMGAPASTANSNALGAFHIQVRDQYNPGIGGTWNWRTALSVINNGNVGIGTTTPDAKLTVKGHIHTNEVKVDLLGAVAPDYVFHKDYDLKSLTDVQDYISINGHLPNIPSAKYMETNGILLKEMNLKLLEKIEELTLYAIEQEKRMETLEAENKHYKSQEERISKLENEMALLLNKN